MPTSKRWPKLVFSIQSVRIHFQGTFSDCGCNLERSLCSVSGNGYANQFFNLTPCCNITYSSYLTDSVSLSFKPLLNSALKYLHSWERLGLLWLDRVVAVKMIHLPTFLSLCQSLPLSIPDHLLARHFNDIYHNKKGGITTSTLF